MRLRLPKSIDELELADQNVFMRVDFNVPASAREPNYKITDPSRILAVLPTLKYALEEGARIILCSHFGRPSAHFDLAYSLKPIGEYLSEVLNQEVFFSDGCTGMGIKKMLAETPPRSVLLLENIRFHREEKSEDVHFYHQLAEYTDVYVNDAFGVCHRNHASVTGLPKIIKNKGMGFLIKKEVLTLNKLVTKPDRPFWALLGGAKVSDKIQLIEKLIPQVDGFCIGGAMAFPFLMAQGFEVGSSFCEKECIDFAKHLLKTAKKEKKEILLPQDHLIGQRGGETRTWGNHKYIHTKRVPEGFSGIDIGPKTVESFTHALSQAKQIFWNGPMGVIEDEQAKKGTVTLAQTLGSWKSKSEVIIGGGDSVVVAHKLGLDQSFAHISTGGGASLTFLEKGTLPGIEALTLPAHDPRHAKL
jgi:phosphoglycerate kinase